MKRTSWPLRIGSIAAAGIVVAVFVLIDWGTQPKTPRITEGVTLLADPAGIVRPGMPVEPLRAVEVQEILLGADGRQVKVRILGGNRTCWSVGRLRITYEDETVLIGIYAGYNKLPEGTVCTAEGVFYELSLRLDEAADGRKVESVKEQEAFPG